jgi:hypothetical protein
MQEDTKTVAKAQPHTTLSIYLYATAEKLL